jgi:sulfate permease, SulP family
MTSDVAAYIEEFRFRELIKFDFTHLKGDIVGGITSAIVALPLALGFGILAYNGDPRGAVAGLYGAIFTGILASFFGGTQRQITGPTGGMTVILTSVYIQYGGPDALLGACLIAGLLQILYGAVKAGRFIALIPHPVIAGFTNGIAILIFSQQLKLFAAAPLIGALTMATIALVPLVHKGLPKALIGLLVGSLAGAFLFQAWAPLRWSVNPDSFAFSLGNTLQVIGTIPQSIPWPHLPSVEWKTWSHLLPAGITISLLGALETLLASVVADSVTGDEHNSNRELMGQGVGNFVAGLFGGIAGTGAIVRTNVNIRAGGVTRLSGIIHGFLLLLIVLMFAPIVGQVPLVVLAGVLMMTAMGMFEWEPIKLIRKTPGPDAVVFLATMAITVVADLITAVLAGFALAGFLFVYRMSELGVTNLLEEKHARRIPPEQEELLRKHRIVVFDIEGPLFFGAAKNFVKEIRSGSEFTTVILNMENVPVIDSTGAIAIEEIVDRLRHDKKRIVIAGLRREVRSVLHRLGITTQVGVGHFAVDLRQAVHDAIEAATGGKVREHLGEYLHPDLMMLDLKASSKEEVFARLVERAYKRGYISNKADFLKDLWEREESESTGMQRGVAIPHSRTGSAGKLVVMFARLAEPLETYESLDGSKVDLVFMIAASDDDGHYLRVLAMLARTLQKPEVLARIRSVATSEEVFDILEHEFAVAGAREK